MNRAATALPLLVLAACTSIMKQPVESAGAPEALCNAGKLDSYVGQTATADIGAKMLTQSGAKILRWVPPRTAVTMDFRTDRLTVSYDDAMMIQRIGCG